MRGKPLRRLALCCAAALLLNGCGGAPDTSDYPVLEAAVASANDAGCKQVKFLMQFTFGEERTTMLFVQGEYTVDTENGYVLSGRMSQTVLGASVTVTFSYADGWYAYIIDGQTMKRAYEEETLRSGFLFSDAFLFDEADVTSMTRSSGDAGAGIYELEIGGDHTARLVELLGEDIYALSQLSKPDKSKTQATDLVCGYTVAADGRLTGRTLNYALSLYDTPPYVPGVEPDYEDYHLELQITMRMQYVYDGVQPPELPDTSGYETVSG